MEINVKSFCKNFLNLNDYIILVLLLFITISINSGYYHVQNFKIDMNYPTKSFLSIINAARYIIPFLIFGYTVFKIIYDKKRIDSFGSAFILFSIFQLILLMIYPRDKDIINVNSPELIDSVHLLMSCISMILLIFLIKNKSKVLKIYISSVLILFCLIWVYFYSKLLYEITFINARDSYLYFTDALKPGGLFLDQTNPRITGLSRISALIFIISFLAINFRNKYNFSYFLLSVLTFFISLTIYGSQTRGGLLILLVTLIIYIFFLKKKNIDKIFHIIIFILIPILIYENLYKPFVINSEMNRINELQGDYDKYKNGIEVDYDRYESRVIILQGKDIQTYSSGRTKIWTESLNIIFKNKYFFGFGPQADRYLLSKNAKNELQSQWGNNSSNGLVYSIMSGGIIGIIFFIFIFYKILSLIYFNFFKRKIFKKNDLFKITCFIYILIMLSRIAFENGFFVFGIDFIIFVSSYYFLTFINNKN